MRLPTSGVFHRRGRPGPLRCIGNFRFYLHSPVNASTILPMPTSIQSQTEREQKRLWVFRNHGILTRIAKSFTPPVSHSAVTAVLYYNLPSKDFRIERALAKAGAPFMKERLAERIAEKRRCA
jgi:hypothetical protein